MNRAIDTMPSLRWVPRLAGASVALYGALVLLARASDSSALASLKVNAGACLVLAGVSLLLLRQHPGERARRAAQIMAAATALIGALTLSEYLFGWDLDIDELLFLDPSPEGGLAIPGRMPPLLALGFIVSAAALLLVDDPVDSRPHQILALVSGLLSLMPLIGYAYVVKNVYGIANYTQMPPPTALALGVLSVGILFARPERGIMGAVADPRLGGLTARRLLPAAVLVPVALGSLALAGQRAWLYDTEFGFSIVTLASIILFSALIWRNCVSLNRVEEERQRLEALRSSGQRFRSLAESATDAIITADSSGRVVSWNKSAEALFGYTEKEIVGESLTLIMPERYRQAYQNGLERLRRTGETHMIGKTVELVGLAKEQREFPLEISLSTWKAGEEAFSTAIIRDITQRKLTEKALRQSEEQLRQSQKMDAVGRLAGGMAHEFNNVLTGIVGLATLIRNGAEAGGSVRTDAEDIIAAARRAGSLLDRLLTFSRRRPAAKSVVDLGKVIAANRNMIAAALGERVSLKMSVEPELVAVNADASQIEQVLLNLCLNARDAVKETGTITVEAKTVDFKEPFQTARGTLAPGRYALLQVSDTGHGIAKEDHARIFEPFFTTKRVGAGVGLGLSIIYGIVKEHNGLIDFYSEPGKITTFKIYLPGSVESSALAGGALAPAAEAKGGSETILIADDEESIRRLLVRILKSRGYSLLVAKDGAEAVELFKTNRDQISLLVLDVIMPKLTGVQAYEAIVSQKYGVKALFMSGHATEKGADFISKHKAPLITKPFLPEDMCAKIRQVLDEPIRTS